MGRELGVRNAAEIGGQLGRRIEVRARPGLHQEQFEVTALDEGPAVSIPLGWLQSEPEADVEAEVEFEAEKEEEPPQAGPPGEEEPVEQAASEAAKASEEPEATADPLDSEEENRILPAPPSPEEP